jgi:hypothetical protein
MRLNPASGWASEQNPSAAIASVNPRCFWTQEAEASTSGTLSEMAVSVMRMW